MAVDGGGHFLPGEQCHDLLLRGDKLSGLGLLQRLANEMGKHFDLRTREQFLNPEKHENITRSEPDVPSSVWPVNVQKQTTPLEVKLEVA